MKRQSLDQIRSLARVAPLRTNEDARRDRLLRWARLLLQRPETPMRALFHVELYAERQRRLLRADNSPMAVAYADADFRSEGLAGDTLGDIEAFFGLDRDDTHRLVCDCKYYGRMTGRSVGRRLLALAEPNPFRRMLMRLGAAA